MSQPLLLEGLKVLDVASWIAAPVAATLLADLGADVIKIEPPETGDGYRNYSLLPVTPMSEENYAWHLDARNRRSLSLNLKTQVGMDILHKLIRECDVYITNHPLPLRRELALTYEDLSPINPRMIYASLTAYGEEGPDRDLEGFDLVAYWGRSGLAEAVRETGAPPAPALAGMGDHPTAVSLYASIMTALLRRERTGEGAFVHTSLLANGLWSASCMAQARFSEADFSTYRNPAWGTYPHTAYETADGRWVSLSMLRTEEDFDRLMLTLGAPELLADERFSDTEHRLLNGSAFIAEVGARIAQHESAALLKSCSEAGLNVVLLARFEELPDDPQIQANSMVVPRPPEVSPYPLVDHPVNVRGLRRAPAAKAPELGEHSEAILQELGYSSEDVAGLKAQGII